MHSLLDNPISYEREFKEPLNLLSNLPSSRRLDKQPLCVTQDKNHAYIILVFNNNIYNPGTSPDDKTFWGTFKAVRENWFWEIKTSIHIEFVDWMAILNRTSEEYLKNKTNMFLKNIAIHENSVYFNLFGLLNESVQELFYHSLADHIDQTIKNLLNKKLDVYRNAPVSFIACGVGGLILYELFKSQRLLNPSLSTNLSESKSVASDFLIKASDSIIYPSKKQEIDELVSYSSQISKTLQMQTIRSSTSSFGCHRLTEDSENFSLLKRINTNSVFFLGCPLSKYLLFSSTMDFWLPKFVKIYNIFHNKDVDSSRLEPLYYPSATILPPSVILPSSKNNIVSRSKNNKISSIQAATNKLVSTFRLNVESIDEKTDIVKLPLMQEKRYGVHSKKPQVATLMLRSNTTQKSYRRVTRLHTLLNVMNISEAKDRNYIVRQLETGRHSNLTEARLPANVNVDDVDVLSEAENSSGLELPVRLDFETHDINVIQSDGKDIEKQCNYWNSQDVAFFILKQITNFRPQISYKDFLKVATYSDSLSNLS